MIRPFADRAIDLGPASPPDDARDPWTPDGPPPWIRRGTAPGILGIGRRSAMKADQTTGIRLETQALPSTDRHSVAPDAPGERRPYDGQTRRASCRGRVGAK